VQLHVHLKKWTLNFNLLYLRNHISHFTKIHRVCWINTHIQSLEVWLKSILPWLKYSIFSRGLFFIGTPCRYRSISLFVLLVSPLVISVYCEKMADLIKMLFGTVWLQHYIDCLCVYYIITCFLLHLITSFFFSCLHFPFLVTFLLSFPLKIGPFHFQAGCRKRWLNVILGCFCFIIRCCVFIWWFVFRWFSGRRLSFVLA